MPAARTARTDAALDFNPKATTHPRNYTDSAFLDPFIDASGAIRVVEHLAGHFEVQYAAGTVRTETADATLRVLRLRLQALL